MCQAKSREDASPAHFGRLRKLRQPFRQFRLLIAGRSGIHGTPETDRPVGRKRRRNLLESRETQLEMVAPPFPTSAAMPTANAAAANPVKARVILRIRVLSCSPDGSANRRLDRTPRLPLTRVVDRQCSPKTTTLCSACGSCLLPGASTTTDSGGAELTPPGMRIGPPARRVGTPHPRVPGRRAWEVITAESCLPRSWSTSWLLGRPGRDGQPQTPTSAAELMTTPATRYGRKLCSTPS